MANAVGTMTSSLTGTLVAICATGQLDETRDTLRALHARGGVRPIAVTFGDAPQPPVREVDGVTVIDGLLPRYLDNVVAARRVSSLPAMAWWRGGDATVLASLAPLVDRLVLGLAEPASDWRSAAALAEMTSLSDVRWTRLTRWRNLMAQFFDLRQSVGRRRISRLEVVAADDHGARLFAAWLASRLPTRQPLGVQVTPGSHFITAITLSGPEHRLELRLSAAGTACGR